MKRLLYVSDSRIGDDKVALNQILDEAQKNNTEQGLTGLLWTNGKQFAQVIEGEQDPIFDVLAGLIKDPRHENLDIVSLISVSERVFGKWSMIMADDTYEDEMHEQLAWLDTNLARIFGHIINTKII